MPPSLPAWVKMQESSWVSVFFQRGNCTARVCPGSGRGVTASLFHLQCPNPVQGAGGGPRQAPSCPSLASRADLAAPSHLAPAEQRDLSKDLGREQDSSPHPAVPCSGAAPRTPSQTSHRLPPPPLLPALPRCLPPRTQTLSLPGSRPVLYPSRGAAAPCPPPIPPQLPRAPASSGPAGCFPTYPQKSIPPDVPPAPCSWVCFVVVVG